jgi:nicotinate phosphoribosyltransferase
VGHGLVTDLYELTMAASYLRRGMTDPATFSLFVRKLPVDRGFLVAAGLEQALDALERFRFDDGDLRYLAGLGFDDVALDGFRDLRFEGDVFAVPEGRVVLPNEPLVEVSAPLPVAQLVETVVLNQITFQTALATKATRCTLATADRAALVDFSLRRTHGVEAGMAAARAGALAGFVGTSNVEAARRLGITAVGTMAHSYIEAFPSERDAFVAFAQDFPDRPTFLVDTYDTERGVAIAIAVADELGLTKMGVRLDSGDLLLLSKRTRRLLDDAGRSDATIIASGGLDEHEVARLLDAGAPIDVFGVGTRIGVSADAPTLDSAYKLVEYQGRLVMKLSPGKVSPPGPKQVYRAGGGEPDVLATRSEPAPPGAEPLLDPVMAGGQRTHREPLGAATERLRRDLSDLPEEAKRLRSPEPTAVTISPTLQALTDELAARLRANEGG